MAVRHRHVRSRALGVAPRGCGGSGARCPPSPLLPCRVLEEKAREYEITDVHNFYASNLFRGSGFTYDRTANTITYTMA